MRSWHVLYVPFTFRRSVLFGYIGMLPFYNGEICRNGRAEKNNLVIRYQNRKKPLVPQGGCKGGKDSTTIHVPIQSHNTTINLYKFEVRFGGATYDTPTYNSATGNRTPDLQLFTDTINLWNKFISNLHNTIKNDRRCRTNRQGLSGVVGRDALCRSRVHHG